MLATARRARTTPSRPWSPSLALLRETVDVLLESAPRGLDLDEVRAHLLRQPHVLGVHDLHATRVSTDLPVLTAHVVLEDECSTGGRAPAVIDQLQRCVSGHVAVGVAHATVQLESAGHEHDVHT